MKEYYSIKLNGVGLNKGLRPSAFLSLILNDMYKLCKYSPTIVLNENYVGCWKVALKYSKWIREEQKTAVTVFRKRSEKFFNKLPTISYNRDKLIESIIFDILYGEGYILHNSAAFFNREPVRAKVRAKVQVIKALTRTNYTSRKKRDKIVFDNVHKVYRITGGSKKCRKKKRESLRAILSEELSPRKSTMSFLEKRSKK